VADEQAPAVPAATVVLLRDTADGLETLMLRRNSRLAFAGGAWVFPGGRIDPADYPGGERPPSDETSGDLPDDHPEALAAARNAAVRETREEADLPVHGNSLVWFSHWTPPPGAPIRFATWFFMTRAPEGAVTIDDGEIHEHVWIQPAEAIRRRDLGEIELFPPTWVTLSTLGEFPTVDAALAFARARPPAYYRTRIAPIEGGRAALWAGDAAYDDDDLARPGPRHRLLMLPDGWRLERTVGSGS
jgi:8-oxo-dGTP pyrophosphatase MutT (NUDIX family)